MDQLSAHSRMAMPTNRPYLCLMASEGVVRASGALERARARLNDVPGVVGTAIGLDDGDVVIQVFVEAPRRAGDGAIPKHIEGVPVRVLVSGPFVPLDQRG